MTKLNSVKVFIASIFLLGIGIVLLYACVVWLDPHKVTYKGTIQSIDTNYSAFLRDIESPEIEIVEMEDVYWTSQKWADIENGYQVLATKKTTGISFIVRVPGGHAFPFGEPSKHSTVWQGLAAVFGAIAVGSAVGSAVVLTLSIIIAQRGKQE